MLEEERSCWQAAENELKNMQEEMNRVKSTLVEVLKYVEAQNEANAVETFDNWCLMILNFWQLLGFLQFSVVLYWIEMILIINSIS